MGWPRKNDEMRLYREKCGAFFVLLVGGERQTGIDAVANALSGDSPSLCYTTVSRDYLAKTWPKRSQWDELPEGWRAAFTRYFDSDDDPFVPEKVRGLWRVGSQPGAKK